MFVIIIRRHEDVPVLQGSRLNDLRRSRFWDELVCDALPRTVRDRITQISANRMWSKKGASGLCRRLWDLATTSLLGFKVLVKKIECLLVRVGATGDREHTLTSLVMGSFGDADASAR